MKKLICLSLALTTAVSVAGCNTPQGQNAAGGAVIGGATGALLGGAIGGSAGAAALGGVAGAATGAMIGSASTPPAQAHGCAQWGYDYYGNRVCRAYF